MTSAVQQNAFRDSWSGEHKFTSPMARSTSKLPNCQLNRLQQIQNSLARAIVKAPKSTHITTILKSLHWLKVNERIEYRLLSNVHSSYNHAT